MLKLPSVAKGHSILDNDQPEIAEHESEMPRVDQATLQAERVEHLRSLLQFDHLLLSEHAPGTIIVGTDEVGRGCLAGPVVAAAVVLPPIQEGSELETELCRLNDSKLIPPDVRAVMAERLKEICRFAIAEASVEEIDEINILQASLLAMRRAVRRLHVEGAHIVLIDGNKKIPSLRSKQITVIGGDGKSASIAAASVIAKVHRDTFMIKLAKKFPDYAWHSNKGYRSRDHYNALETLGITKWHRRSFNLGLQNDSEDELESDVD